MKETLYKDFDSALLEFFSYYLGMSEKKVYNYLVSGKLHIKDCQKVEYAGTNTTLFTVKDVVVLVLNRGIGKIDKVWKEKIICLNL